MNVENSIPIPTSTGAGRPTIYPFHGMDVGDSVFFEGEAVGGRAYLSAMQHGRMHNKKFTGRTEPNGVRIWRTA